MIFVTDLKPNLSNLTSERAISENEEADAGGERRDEKRDAAKDAAHHSHDATAIPVAQRRRERA